MIQVKKMLSNVDNLTENEKKRFELLTSIQNMIAAEYKYEDIASTLGISTVQFADIRTVTRLNNAD